MESTNKYVLLCAPSGCGLRGAMTTLTNALGGVGVVAHEDVEDVLCELEDTREALRLKGVYKPDDVKVWKPSMYDITWNLARSEVTQLWERAASRVLQRLDNTDKPIRLLSCHLTYYGGRRTEFYSPLNASMLSSSTVVPSHVLLLIDDVYDMYVRLASEGTLFAPEALLKGHMANVADEERRNLRDLSLAHNLDICTRWKATVITHLLAWRHDESLAAERLAREVRADFLAWGTKQLTRAVQAWITGNAIPVYLSHPISRPRRKYTDHWPQVVYEFNSLQADLVANGVTCVMPTAIDEYRITKKARAGGEEQADGLGQYRLPMLGPRWPLPADENALLYSAPSTDQHITDPEHKDILALQVWTSDDTLEAYGEALSPAMLERIDVVLQTLEHHIQFQISSRDHLFVALTRGLIVFRPLVYDGEFSSGVEAEIRHWSLIAEAGQKKRIVFIHFREDLIALHKHYSEGGTKDEQDETVRQEMINLKDETVRQEMINLIAGTEGLSVDRVATTLEEIENNTKEELLDRGRVSPVTRRRIMRDLAKYRQRAEEVWEEKQLRYEYGWEAKPPERLRQLVKQLVVSNMDELRTHYQEIAEFLRGDPHRHGAI